MPLVKSTDEMIVAAADALRRGELVAFPTETVYGLGADARKPSAVAKVFDLKERPQFNPLIVHVKDLDKAQELCSFSPAASKLAERFWPGALTLVLPLKATSGICDLVTAGLDTLAVRSPNHPVAQQLLDVSGIPIAAPSANKSGRVSPTRAEHVAADLGDEPAYVLDNGPCPVGVESTIVGFSEGEAVLLRSGGVSRDALEEVLGHPVKNTEVNTETPNAPGQLLSHYAPNAGIRLNVMAPGPGEAYLAFGPDIAAHSGPSYNLSEAGDLREAAANLFAALRILDATGAEVIAVSPIPFLGLGEAINDRLRRAAAPRGNS